MSIHFSFAILAANIACATLLMACDQRTKADIAEIPTDNINLPPVAVRVKFGQMSRDKILKAIARIVVTAYYSGGANVKGLKYAGEMGDITWAKPEQIELKRTGVAILPKKELNKNLTTYFRNGTAWVETSVGLENGLLDSLAAMQLSRDYVLSCDDRKSIDIFDATKSGIDTFCELKSHPRNALF